MKRILLITTLVLGNLGHTTAQEQLGGVPLWTNYYNGPVANNSATAAATDGSGNVFVTGYSEGSGGDYDYATIKYSGAGVPLWTNRYNGLNSDDEYANAIAVDGSGNVFVSGYSTISAGSSDYATIKYSGAGVPLWTNRYNGPGGDGSDQAYAIAVDTNSNVFVTGRSSGDYATVKYSGAGVPLWTNRYTGPGNGLDSATAVAVDGSGNVFVTGSSQGSGDDIDYATIKYSGAGVALWTNRYNGPANYNDQVHAMAVDRSGNVFVTGSSTGSGSSYDYATIKYSGAGVPLWTNRYTGINSDDSANAIALDRSGNVFVTGYVNSSGSGNDYATIAYSGAGVPLWTNRYNGPANLYDRATALAVAGSGNVFVTGYSTGTNGYYNYATIKYSAIPPSLTVARTTTNTVSLSWPSPSTGFTLQQNTNSIATVNWSNVVPTPTDNGTTKTVTVNPPTGNRFFRLKSQ